VNATQTTKSSGRTAFAAVEVMLALMLLALALLPLLGTIAGTGREAGFTEAHLLAHARVQTLLDAVEAQGWIEVPAGEPVKELEAPASAGQPPEPLWGPAPDSYGELLYAERLGEGLVRLGARVRWGTRSSSKTARESEAGSTRVIRRPDGSWTQTIKLERTR
jgi:hypothetical protein